jgi:hypothetical protein
MTSESFIFELVLLTQKILVSPSDYGQLHKQKTATALYWTRPNHTSSPIVQGLRSAFMEQLLRAQPRFIIETKMLNPWIPGGDSGKIFPELRDYLRDNYQVVTEGSGYVVYERR